MQEKSISLKKITTSIFLVSILQAGALISVIVYIFFEDTIGFRRVISNFRFYTIPILLLLLLYTYFMFKHIQIMLKSNRQYSIISETNQQLIDLNNTLRSQRHDFMNHLQVVYGLIEMDEYSDAKDYIEKIYKDMQKVNGVLKTKNPAVNALIQAKIIHAEKLDIIFKANLKTQLQGLPMPSWEFCKILANIIDNGIYALKEKPNKKLLYLELYEDMKGFGFIINNNGSKIPEDIIDKIFDGGFTTKGKEGEGMGLAITKSTLQRFGGSISVISNDDITQFKGYIPKMVNQPQ
ncbi:sensor histidine kinase [Alkaliphilus serpentinus]|nr:Spo0B domain-containing protein [Alkaliphilus serpentinus]